MRGPVGLKAASLAVLALFVVSTLSVYLVIVTVNGFNNNAKLHLRVQHK